MAGNKRPSFLKRQKEQQRMARAAEKRESRRLRKQAKKDIDSAALELDESIASAPDSESAANGDETEPD